LKELSEAERGFLPNFFDMDLQGAEGALAVADGILRVSQGDTVEGVFEASMGAIGTGAILSSVYALKGAKGISAGEKVIINGEYDNKIPRFGSEWTDYFTQKYGAQNVSWDSKNAEIDSIIKELQGSGFKNNPLRMAYEDEVRGLANYVDELYQRGYTEKEIAQLANQARRELGIQYKDMTPQPLRDYIYYINNQRYGDPLGPTYEYFVDKKVADLHIIESASHPNGDIDKLLVKFKEWMEENYDTMPR